MNKKFFFLFLFLSKTLYLNQKPKLPLSPLSPLVPPQVYLPHSLSLICSPRFKTRVGLTFDVFFFLIWSFGQRWVYGGARSEPWLFSLFPPWSNRFTLHFHYMISLEIYFVLFKYNPKRHHFWLIDSLFNSPLYLNKRQSSSIIGAYIVAPC